MKSVDINQKLSSTPTIPQSVIDRLPSFLREPCIHLPSKREKDVFITAALGVLSGCLPSVSGRYYTQRFYPNLYFAIVAPPGNSKSLALFAKKLAKALHDDRKKDTPNRITPTPRTWGLFLASNTSAARIIQQLADNQGEGILFESEIDTLVNALMQEWGNFSANLREAFQHESISYSRVIGNLDIHIETPKLSMVLTGTPNQMQRLLPSVENGLFSRMGFYVYKQDFKRVSVKPKHIDGGFEEFFDRKGEEVRQMAVFLETYPTEFTLSDSQWAQMDDFLNNCIESSQASHGEDTHSSSLRMGIIFFRIAMILTALRKWESRNKAAVVECSDNDFKVARELTCIYMSHTLTMLEITPQTTVREHLKTIDRFLQALPYKFTRAEAVELGKKLKIPESTVGKHLKVLLDSSKLSKEAQGIYTKPIQE
ncbi:MAG: VirE protein [Flaviaesturariibacter sp.]|nr:VirE protein [Flaviaesturariibacter sp.]